MESNYGNLIWCSDVAEKLMTDASQISIPTSLKILCATQKIIRAIFRKPKLNKKEKKYTTLLALI